MVHLNFHFLHQHQEFPFNVCNLTNYIQSCTIIQTNNLILFSKPYYGKTNVIHVLCTGTFDFDGIQNFVICITFLLFVLVLSVVLSNKVGRDGEAGEKDVWEVDASWIVLDGV